jgi:hypothetical protein
MTSLGFELAIPAVTLLQAYVLDRTATGIGELFIYGSGCQGIRGYNSFMAVAAKGSVDTIHLGQWLPRDPWIQFI